MKMVEAAVLCFIHCGAHESHVKVLDVMHVIVRKVLFKSWITRQRRRDVLAIQRVHVKQWRHEVQLRMVPCSRYSVSMIK